MPAIAAITELLERPLREQRQQLFEHEVYAILDAAGLGPVPEHRFLAAGELDRDVSAELPGERVVLKLVAPGLVSKTDVGGVRVVANRPEAIASVARELLDRAASPRGVLVVEHVANEARGFGGELFVGIRRADAFGPVLVAGLGGVDSELLADRMKRGAAVARALATTTDADAFLERFRRTVAYHVLSGAARGRPPVVSDAELRRCFAAFLRLADELAQPRDGVGWVLEELEVNPFAFRSGRPVPLDGHARLGEALLRRPPPPRNGIEALLEPRSLALLGVSASDPGSVGRIILRNVIAGGYPPDRLWVVKPGRAALEGIRCVPSVADLPEPVDVLAVAVGGPKLPALIDEIIGDERARSVILVPGGVGEVDGTTELQARVEDVIARRRRSGEGAGPVFLGPNSLGLLSRPGGCDTLFIPDHKLTRRWDVPPRRIALLSQSGAFIVTRMSVCEELAPAIAVSIGNQLDLTLTDLLEVVGSRDDIVAIGVYVEGFRALDGLRFLRTVSALRAAGKDVVLYKGGRTAAGHSAAAGHTASLATDYQVLRDAAEQAGALVADSFSEFGGLLDLCERLHSKPSRGLRIGAISNAGYETVGMADAIGGDASPLELAELSDECRRAIAEVLAQHGLERLVNLRNPLDITPMAAEPVYQGVVQAMVDDPGVDALLVAAVPLSPAVRTAPEELSRPDSLASCLTGVLASAEKPAAVVIDSGRAYDPLARALAAGGLPTFRSADTAVRLFGRYLARAVAADGSP